MLTKRLLMTGLLAAAAAAGCDSKKAADTTSATNEQTGQNGQEAQLPAPNPTQADVYLTAKGTANRLTKLAPVTFTAVEEPAEQSTTIFVDYRRPFQTIVGVGGAFTDATAETFYKLPKDKQQELLTAYFDPQKGIGYSLGRTHIHSCDFSSESYTYVQDGDTTLNSFSLAHDQKYRIPFIKAALQTAGNKITMYASPWSPPAWMKTNNNMLQGGQLKPEYRRTWARYFSRFVNEYEKAGIPMWGLTVQNEPLAKQTWESCIFSAEDEKNFVRDHLGPELQRAGLGRLKLMIWDHNRGPMHVRAQAAYNDPEAAKYIWGMAFHWYVGNHFENVQRVRESFPDKHLLFSEGCNYPFEYAKINDWNWGEIYGESLVNDFNNGAEGWTDWNMILNEQGGPNHVNNFCYAPVIANTRTGQVTYMNSFYYLGHFSKFVRPGARRLATSSYSDDLLTTAFRNPDGKIATVVFNKTDKPQEFQVFVAGKLAKATSPAHSIITMVF